MKILIIFIVGVALGFWLGRNRADSRLKIQDLSEKQQRKEKIMRMFGTQESIRNDDAQTLLGVSDASATNYLNELEQEGKIEQVGTVGRFVSYRKRPQ